MYGLEFAALYTLQDRLPGNAQQLHRLEHLHIAFGRAVNKARTQLVVDSDAPRRTGCDLLACYEAIIEPAMQGGGREPQCACGLLDGHTLSARYVFVRVEARYLPVCAQACYAIGGERQAGSDPAALAIEDAGDDGIGIMSCQTPQQINSIIGGADWRGMRARQRYVDLAQEAATPAQRQMSVGLGARDLQGDILEQRAQQFLAIAIACRGSRPDAFEIFAEGEDRLAFFACERSGARALSIGELSFGGLELLQGAFPLGFEPGVDPIQYTGRTLSFALSCGPPPLRSSSSTFRFHRSAVSRECGRNASEGCVSL